MRYRLKRELRWLAEFMGLDPQVRRAQRAVRTRGRRRRVSPFA